MEEQMNKLSNTLVFVILKDDMRMVKTAVILKENEKKEIKLKDLPRIM
jgi:hypothetical protein